MIDKRAREISLINAYVTLCKNVSAQLDQLFTETPEARGQFEKKIKLKPAIFFARFKNLRLWSPTEIIQLLALLKTKEEKTTVIQNYARFIDGLHDTVKNLVSVHKIKLAWFENQLNLSRVTFYRRMKGEIQWSADELILLVKAIDKADGLFKND